MCVILLVTSVFMIIIIMTIYTYVCVYIYIYIHIYNYIHMYVRRLHRLGSGKTYPSWAPPKADVTLRMLW